MMIDAGRLFGAALEVDVAVPLECLDCPLKSGLHLPLGYLLYVPGLHSVGPTVPAVVQIRQPSVRGTSRQ